MSLFHNNPLIGASGSGTDEYTIERSLRFNSDDSTYLSRTPEDPNKYADTSIDTSTAYRYHRILFEGDANGGSVSEIEFYDINDSKIDASDTNNSNGTVATNATQGLAGWTAFNGTRGGSDYSQGVRKDAGVGSAGFFISKDWGSGNTKTIYGVKVWGVNNYGLAGNTANRYMKLQGSNDNSSWTDLQTWNHARTGSWTTDSANEVGHVSETLDSDPNRKTWTWAGWVKRGNLGGTYALMGAYTDSNNRDYFNFNSSDQLGLFDKVSGTTQAQVYTDAVFRDCSAWYHIVFAVDTTQATGSDRIKIYVNGVQQTLTFSTTPSQNALLYINTTSPHLIGDLDTSVYLDGYLADVHFIDGQALAPTDFGAFDDNNVWQPKAYSGTYGFNGFHLDFSDDSTSSALGTDSSGNSNTWAVNNITVASDFSVASPTRFTWSTADTGWTLSNSNYNATNTTSGYRQVYSSSLNGSTTYHFMLSERPGDNNGGWFFADNTNVTDTHPDQLGGDSLGLRTAETGLGAYGSFATANGVSAGQNVITGFNSISTSPGSYSHSEWVINMTARKVWVREVGDATWIGGGDPTNSSSTASFLLPTGTIYFGYIAYSSNETNANLVTSVLALSAGNDSLLDSPTNGDTANDTGLGGEIPGNYATLNPLHNNAASGGNGAILSDGNLKTTFTTSSSTGTVPATIFVSSGKWYCEFTAENISSSAEPQFGIVRPDDAINGYIGKTGTNGVGYEPFQDRRYNAGTPTTSMFGQTTTSGTHTYGLALDLDDGTLDVYEDGTLLGELVSGLSGTWTFAAADIGGADVPTIIANFGQRPFAYSAPSGFKALCTTNLDDPTIADGSTYFTTTTYSGNSGDGLSTTQDIVTGFSPDMVWIKHRNGTNSHVIFDTIRGAGKRIFPNLTNSEDTKTQTLSTFNNNGFTLNGDNSVNDVGGNYVAWAWDAGSSTVSNTDGDVISSVRANTSAGFSIVKWNPDSNGQSVGHGLNAVPEFIMAKALDNGHSWRVYHKDLTSGENLLLDTNQPEDVYSADIDIVNSTVFDGGQGLTGSSLNNNIAYCFTSVEGYSAFGSYTGNGIANGPFVYTGFRPRWVLFKTSTETAAGNTAWYIYDAARLGYNGSGTNKSLKANTTDIEANAGDFDLLSNGFKLRNNNGGLNTSNATYIYAAFAENPFKYARAR